MILVGMVFFALYPSGRHPVQICTEICAGYDEQCQEDNICDMIRHTEAWSLQGVKIQNFGRLEEPTTRFIAIPPFGKKRIFQFTPTEGTSTSRTIEVLIVTFSSDQAPSPDTPDVIINQINNMNPNTTMVKIYRRFTGNKPWTLVTDIIAQKNDLPPSFEKQVTILPNGVVEIQNIVQTNDGTGAEEITDVALDFAKY
jgi:hypothetical protein